MIRQFADAKSLKHFIMAYSIYQMTVVYMIVTDILAPNKCRAIWNTPADSMSLHCQMNCIT